MYLGEGDIMRSLQDRISTSQSLVAKLKLISPQRTLGDWSPSGLYLVGALPQRFNTTFTDEELKLIGDIAVQKADELFEIYMKNSLNSILRHNYSGKKLDLKDINFSDTNSTKKSSDIIYLHSEIELLDFLIEYQTPTNVSQELSDMSISRIEKVRKRDGDIPISLFSPINIAILKKKFIEENFDLPDSEIPLEFILLSKKNSCSQAKKVLKGLTKLIEPDSCDLDITTTRDMSKKEFSEIAFDYLRKLFNKHQTFYGGHEYQNEVPQGLGGQFNSIVGDIIQSDIVRYKICTTNTKEATRLTTSFTHKNFKNIFKIIRSRQQYLNGTFQKDGANSIVYNIASQGIMTNLILEAKITTLYALMEAEFGERSHGFVYKPQMLHELKEKVDSSEELQGALQNLCVMRKLDSSSILLAPNTFTN